MALSRVYRQRRRAESTARTRAQIMDAVRTLLEERTFHEASVEEIAQFAGVSRATLYQHFGSRLDLVDAICETFDANPALLELREIVESPDSDVALAETIANSIRFWSAEDPILSQLYGVVAIDPAAHDLV